MKALNMISLKKWHLLLQHAGLQILFVGFLTNYAHASGGKKSTTENLPNTDLPTEVGHPGSDPLEYVPGELIIGFKTKEDASSRSSIFKKYQGTESLALGGGGQVFLVKFPPKTNLEELRKKLANEKGIKYAEPNIKMRVFPGKIPSEGTKDSGQK